MRAVPRLVLAAPLVLAALLAFPLVADAQPAPAPPPPPTAEQRALMGHYGSGLRVVVVLEEGGRLAAWADGRAITLYRTGERAYAAHGGPAWLGATFAFTPDSGAARLMRAGDRVFVRRPTGPAEGDVFRIVPLRPVADVIADARRAGGPPGNQSGAAHRLVDLARHVAHLRLDIRYATADNFMGAPLYASARAFAQRPAADALARVQADLAARGLALVVYDAYRPWYVTKAFWDATPPAQRGFVAHPAEGSRHNRGAAVDVGLYALQTGEPVEMPSDYDEFTDRAAVDYAGGSSRARYYRGVLRAAMRAHGFTPNPTEWWHFDFGDWRSFPLLNLTFEELGAR